MTNHHQIKAQTSIPRLRCPRAWSKRATGRTLATLRFPSRRPPRHLPCTPSPIIIERSHRIHARRPHLAPLRSSPRIWAWATATPILATTAIIAAARYRHRRLHQHRRMGDGSWVIYSARSDGRHLCPRNQGARVVLPPPGRIAGDLWWRDRIGPLRARWSRR